MKRVVIGLMIAGFVAATTPALWAQGGEPSPPRSDVKAPKPKTDSQKKSDTKK
jgi:hypothetical protein